jgi:hypothetical protein
MENIKSTIKRVATEQLEHGKKALKKAVKDGIKNKLKKRNPRNNIMKLRKNHKKRKK